MKPMGIIRALVLAVVLLASAWAFSQDTTGGDAEWIQPLDKVFHVPEDVTLLWTYVGWWWLLPMIFTAGLTLWVAGWINGDARMLKMRPDKWNYLLVGICLAFLVLSFVLPAFATIPVVLVSVCLVARHYVGVRNAKVIPPMRLFTREHRAGLKIRFLAKFGVKVKGAEERIAAIAKIRIPVGIALLNGRSASRADETHVENDPMGSVKEILARAVKRHARNVYLTLSGTALSTSLLIDGVVHDGESYGTPMSTGILKVIRGLVDLDSPEPKFRLHCPTLDARLDVCVTEIRDDGLVMRMLSDEEEMRTFDDLGMSDKHGDALCKALESEHGLIVVASPAHMGSHTTIYAMVASLDPFSRNISTFERPILGNLPSIEQNDMARLDKSLTDIIEDKTRQDYDLFMVCDAVDKAVTESALRSVESEQMFIFRMELPDVVSVLAHLAGSGIDPALVAGGLHTIIAQRLVRVLCKECRVKTHPPEDLLAKIGVDPGKVNNYYEVSVGCDACGDTGFRGRTAILEVWHPGKESRELIASAGDVKQLRAAMHKDGARSLQNVGLARVFAGVTSLQELTRVLKQG